MLKESMPVASASTASSTALRITWSAPIGCPDSSTVTGRNVSSPNSRVVVIANPAPQGSRYLLEDSNVSVCTAIPTQRLSVRPAPIPSSRIPTIFHQPTPTRSAPSRPQRSIAAPAANWPASSTETVAITPMREPATVIASTMMTLISAPLQSQTGWRAAAANSPKPWRATSISASARKAVSVVAQARAPKTPTRSPSLDITATCTEPATPARTAKATTRTFTAASISPQTERAGACRPSPEWSCQVRLARRCEHAVDGRLRAEHLDLGRVHFALADSGPALGIVRRIQVLVAMERVLAGALVVRHDELDVRGEELLRRCEVAQRLILRSRPRVHAREGIGRPGDDLRPAVRDAAVAGQVRLDPARATHVGVERAEADEAAAEPRRDAEPVDRDAAGGDPAELEYDPAAVHRHEAGGGRCAALGVGRALVVVDQVRRGDVRPGRRSVGNDRPALRRRGVVGRHVDGDVPHLAGLQALHPEPHVAVAGCDRDEVVVRPAVVLAGQRARPGRDELRRVVEVAGRVRSGGDGRRVGVRDLG